MLIKHAHMLLAACSVLLFIVRFILLINDNKILKSKWLKIAPHIIDTALFILGIVMVINLSLYPWHVNWISEKLLAVLAYIFTGYFTLKLARNRTMQIFGFLGAMGWVALIVRIAITKQTYLF